ENLHLLYVDEFKMRNVEFIDTFYDALYGISIEYKFQLILGGGGNVTQSFSGRQSAGGGQNYLSILNPLMIPLTFTILLMGTMSHYSMNLSAALNRALHGESKVTDSMFDKASDEFMAKTPFDFYFINYSWDFYAKDFNKRYQKESESESKNLALAAFVLNAARTCLVADLPCEGHHWQETLETAETSKDPFVQISVTLYNLCNFRDSQGNSELLHQRLAAFKETYPEYHRLLGIKE
ncbi:MAG: hypothetical protein GY940_26935, partial [bacterium]|nr:hypothetical protein [bacterium]